MSSSYVSLTLPSTSWSFTGQVNTKNTNNLTTNYASTDWTNGGAGKFQYNGTVPISFVISCNLSQTSADHNFNPNISIRRNDNIIVGNTYLLTVATTQSSFNQESSLGPETIYPGDYFYIYVNQGVLHTGTSTNFTLNLTLTSLI